MFARSKKRTETVWMKKEAVSGRTEIVFFIYFLIR